jgi:hypothetical protein
MLRKGSLYEVEYKDILKPETLAMLKGKARQNLQQMLSDRSIRQALSNMKGLAAEIQAAEADYRDELEMVAKQIVTDAYPIIDYADIQIDAKIVPQVAPLTNLDPDEEDPAAPDFGDQDPEKLKAKRRIINGITQGAALKGTFSFLMFREYLDELDPTLVDKYMAITKAADVPYNDEDVIAMMMAQIEQGQMAGEGQSEMVYDDETEKFTIIARATNFPVLVHEIVKGLYEITGTEGFGRNKEKNQAIVKAVDKAGNEPEDLQLGRYFEQAISDLYDNSNIKDKRVRDFFYAEVYKLDEDEFLSFVENAVNNELEGYQKRWATDTMKNIQSELEGGEEDLYEDEDFDLSDNPFTDKHEFKVGEKVYVAYGYGDEIGNALIADKARNYNEIDSKNDKDYYVTDLEYAGHYGDDPDEVAEMEDPWYLIKYEDPQEGTIFQWFPQTNLIKTKLTTEEEDFDLSDNPLVPNINPNINYNKLPVSLVFGYDLDNVTKLEQYVRDNYNVVEHDYDPKPNTDAIIWVGRGDDTMNGIDVLSQRLAKDKTFHDLVNQCDGKGDFSDNDD